MAVAGHEARGRRRRADARCVMAVAAGLGRGRRRRVCGCRAVDVGRVARHRGVRFLCGVLCCCTSCVSWRFGPLLMLVMMDTRLNDGGKVKR